MYRYGGKNYVEEMRTTWEKFFQHIGIYLGQDISTEFRTTKIIVITKPIHSQEILERNMLKVQLRNPTHARRREARNKVLESLASDAAINNLDTVLKTTELQN